MAEIELRGFIPLRPASRRFCWLYACTALAALTGCGPTPAFHVSGSDWSAYVQRRDGGSPSGDVDGLRFKSGVCDGQNLRQEFATLTEDDFLSFVAKQGVDVRVERQRADLVYANLSGAGATTPVRMRVAILKNADEAGRELHDALLQHGTGSWGVHRSNLAVLGPVAKVPDDLLFAAKTRLACWGVFTIADGDDAYVVPGGYAEL